MMFYLKKLEGLIVKQGMTKKSSVILPFFFAVPGKRKI